MTPPDELAPQTSRWAGWLSRYGERAGLGLLLGMLGCLCLMTLHPFLALQDSDGAIFLILAQSLAHGQGYVLSSLPQPEPYFPFTPLFPLQLSGLMGLFPTDSLIEFVPIAKLYVWFLFILTLGVFYGMLRPAIGWTFALILTSILAVNGTLHQYLPDVLSDVPYLLVSLICLKALLPQGNSSEAVGKWRFPFALLTLAMLILTRPIGLSLGLADILVSGFQRQWKRVILVGLVCVVSYGGWITMEHSYRSSHPSHNPAMNVFLGNTAVKLEVLKYFAVQNPEDEEGTEKAAGILPWIGSSLHRVEQYSRMMAQDVVGSSSLPGFIKLFLTLTSLGLILYGLWQVSRRVHPLIGLYPLVYLGVLCTYPYVSGRYLIPLAPFIIVFAFVGAALLLKNREHISEKQRFIGLLLMALLVFNQQFDEAAQTWIKQASILGNFQTGPAVSDTQKRLYQFYQALGENAPSFIPDGSVIFTRKPEILYFYTGYRGERFPFFQSPEKLHPWLQTMCRYYVKAHVTQQCYLLDDGIYKESKKILKDYATQYAPHLTPAYEVPDSAVHLWQIKRTAE